MMRTGNTGPISRKSQKKWESGLGGWAIEKMIRRTTLNQNPPAFARLTQAVLLYRSNYTSSSGLRRWLGEMPLFLPFLFQYPYIHDGFLNCRAVRFKSVRGST